MNIINDMLVDKCFLDNANARAVVPAYKEKTDSGNPITLTDSVENKSLGMKLYGWSKQVVTTGKNLCSIKSCQLSTNIVESDIVLWTKSSQVYYAFDTQNISGSEAYLSISYYDAGKKRLGSNGITVVCDGTRKTGSFNGKYAMSGSDIDLTTIEYISVRLGLYDDSVTPSFIDNVIVSDDRNVPFEPYTGGKPSPSPEYPQEIVSVGQKLSTGKNLINVDEYYSQFKQADGTYKSKTVTLNDIRISLSEFVGKEITISVKLTVGANVSGVFLMYISSEQKKINGSVIRSGLTGKSILTITPVSNTDYFVISFGSGNDDVIFSDFQIEAGSIATSYEPYTGGVLTLYQKDIEVRVTGKNLFDANDVSKGYISDDTGNNIVATNSYCSNFIDVSAKTKYYLHSSQDRGKWGAFYDSSKTFILGIGSDKYNSVFETPENAAYVRFTVNYNNNNPDFARNVIFAKSTIAVPFEPYHEPQSLSISTPTGLPAIPVDTDGNYTDVNGQQWIADYIDLKRGKYVQRVWQKMFDGSESWDLCGDTGFLLDNILPEKMSNREMLCNQFSRRGGGTNSNIMIVGAFSANSSIYIENCTLVDNTLVDNMVSKWKMHLAKHPLVVTTYLNEQVERDLTPEEIETYKNLVTYAGTTIVENDSDCWMDVTYKAGTSGKSKNEALRWYFKNVMPLVE